MRMTHATVEVAAALMLNPRGRHWGYDLSRQAKVRSGAMYPILRRMLAEGWLSDGWESPEEIDDDRPARRYYTITDDGHRELGALLARASEDSRFSSWVKERFA